MTNIHISGNSKRYSLTRGNNRIVFKCITTGPLYAKACIAIAKYIYLMITNSYSGYSMNMNLMAHM